MQAQVGSGWQCAGIGLHAYVKLLPPSGRTAPPPASKQNSVATSQEYGPHAKLPASIPPPEPPSEPVLPPPASRPQAPECAKGFGA
jgi:hypothetical protein